MTNDKLRTRRRRLERFEIADMVTTTGDTRARAQVRNNNVFSLSFPRGAPCSPWLFFPYTQLKSGLEENLHRKLNDAIGGSGVMKSVDLADAVAYARGRPPRAVADSQDARRTGLPFRQIRVEAAPRHVAVHIAELRLIEDVEHLKPQLQSAGVVDAEREVLEQRQVGYVDSGPAQEVTRIGPLGRQGLRHAGQSNGLPVEVFIALLALIRIAGEVAARKLGPTPADALGDVDVVNAGVDVLRLA